MTYFAAITDSPVGDDCSVERSVLAGIRVEKVSWRDEDSLIEALSDVDAVMCMHAPMSSTVIRGLRRCKIIATYGVGVDNIDVEEAEARGIAVAGVADYCSEEVANHTLALILAWNRKILDYHRFVIKRGWNERQSTTGNWGCGQLSRLSGQTLGLVGFGHIGQSVASRARAFGIQVLAFDLQPDENASQRLGVRLVTLEETLAQSDFLSLHVPLSAETQHLIDDDTIKLMKPGAVLVNTSRGALVNEAALVKALEGGHLAGALLDVYEKQPLPPEHPLRDLPNVILTPHVAFYSEGALETLRRRTAEAVLKCLEPGE